MNIKNEDLQLLIQIENFLGTNFPRGSEGQDSFGNYARSMKG